MDPFLNIVAPEINPDKIMGLSPLGDKPGTDGTESPGSFLDILGLSLAGKISPEMMPFEAFLEDSQLSDQLPSPVVMGASESVMLSPELIGQVLPNMFGTFSLPITSGESDNPVEAGTKPTLLMENIAGLLKNTSNPIVIIEAPSLDANPGVEKLPGLSVGFGLQSQVSGELAVIPETVTGQTETPANSQGMFILQSNADPASLSKEVSNSALWGNLASALNIRQMRIMAQETTPSPAIQAATIGLNMTPLQNAVVEENAIIKPAVLSSEPAVVVENNTEEEPMELAEDGVLPESKFDLGDDSPETEIISRLTESIGKTSGASRQSAEISTTTAETASRQETALQAREAASPTRFVLPENLKGQNLEQGRTIMIKMEPENLGAVRMTMSSMNDTISARLVVDSPMARTAVEANLNQLLEQLDRQGIKVDFFDVSVGGSLVGDNAKEHYAHSTRHSAGRFVSDFEKIWSGEDGLSSSLRLNYVGASGVNCLA